MPKAFTDQEKEIIRERLREKGRALFEAHGLRKTSVDEIVQAVSISKGAFYLFYKSKEELFLEILEQIEAEVRNAILDFTIQPGEHARENVRRILSRLLLTWDAYPLLKNFSGPDFDYLVRKLPAERVQAHANSDADFIRDFTRKLKREGIAFKAAPRVVVNLLRALFIVSLHRDELGEASYEESMQILTDLVAGYLTGGAR
jgi:AcrR family transcriptional regulator